MAIEYTEEKRFTVEQVEAVFKSVGWESAQWPERLFKALQHSDTVISAWDGGHLVGLVTGHMRHLVELVKAIRRELEVMRLRGVRPFCNKTSLPE